MFDEVFGGVNSGGLYDKKPKCPCGCTCWCEGGNAEQRVSHTSTNASNAHNSEYTEYPIPD